MTRPERLSPYARHPSPPKPEWPKLARGAASEAKVLAAAASLDGQTNVTRKVLATEAVVSLATLVSAVERLTKRGEWSFDFPVPAPKGPTPWRRSKRADWPVKHRAEGRPIGECYALMDDVWNKSRPPISSDEAKESASRELSLWRQRRRRA